jgi:hypothetical protein
MSSAWSAFLSCDARDMCREGLAIARVYLTWLAVLFRVFTLWLFLQPDFSTWLLRASSAFYWMTRLDERDFQTYRAIREDVDRTHVDWADGRLPDDDARSEARKLAERLREWSDHADPHPPLFTTEWLYMGGDEPCPSFDVYYERLGVFEREDGSECIYLVFVY